MSETSGGENAFPELLTERLRLRRIIASDVSAVLDLFGDERVVEFYDLARFTSPDQAEKMISQFDEMHAARKGIRWAITLRSEDRLIGTCGFNEWLKISRRGTLGYDLTPSHWNHGYMTEALRAVMDYGFKEMNLNRLEAYVMSGNLGSIQLLRKLGFQLEGVLRQRGFWKGAFHDLQLFASLREDAMVQGKEWG
jgi:ribosomal-protein-alanine N-acetyltransferase